MNRDYKYYVSLILLLIIPISAVGLYVSIHKCRHDGTVHVSFFEISSKNNNDCCGMNNMPRCGRAEMTSKVNTKSSHEADMPGCAGMSAGAIKTCCSPDKSDDGKCESKDEFVSIGSSAITNNNEHFIKEPCCSNSEISYSVNVVTISLEKILLLKLQPLILEAKSLLIRNDLLIKDRTYANNFQYPLKKPIFSIISFIHKASNNLGDDSAAALPTIIC